MSRPGSRKSLATATLSLLLVSLVGCSDGPIHPDAEKERVAPDAPRSAQSSSTNTPPQLSLNVDNHDTVTVVEGETAVNNGTASDPDGDKVQLSTSVGSIHFITGPAVGWEFQTTDGPEDSQEVTVTANDGVNAPVSDTFQLVVENEPPETERPTGDFIVDDLEAKPPHPLKAGTEWDVEGAFTDPARGHDSYACSFLFVTTENSLTDRKVQLDGLVSSGPELVEFECLNSLVISEVGVYRVAMAVRDDDGGSNSSTAVSPAVIYDPNAREQAGGWVESPDGKITFSSEAKYQSGEDTPEGHTSFVVNSGGLRFHSSHYDWLVADPVEGWARLRGTGRIDGSVAPTGEEYQFEAWLVDSSDADGGEFRIRVWYTEGGTEQVVFDNAGHETLGDGQVNVRHR